MNAGGGLGPAVAIVEPGPPAVPVLLDSPHSGLDMPGDFRHCASLIRIRRTADAFVERLFGDAPSHGATLVHARFPRSYIDPNRADDDIDERLLAEPWPGVARPGAKAALGIGLLASRDIEGPLYDRKLAISEVRARIEGYYRPYHEVVRSRLNALHARFGAVWHLNCHSMKSISAATSPEGPGVSRPDAVLGNRDDTSCARTFVDLVGDFLTGRGYRVAINDPYKGVELVRRYSDPSRNRHSLQIELNRSLYMDEANVEPHEGFDALRRDLSDLTDSICRNARAMA